MFGRDFHGRHMVMSKLRHCQTQLEFLFLDPPCQIDHRSPFLELFMEKEDIFMKIHTASHHGVSGMGKILIFLDKTLDI